MTPTPWQVTPVPLPAQSRLQGLYPRPDLVDAFTLRLPAGASTDPETLARHVFGQPAPWVATLMRLRDAIVGRLGLKTAQALQRNSDRAERIYIFKICDRFADEIVLGEDDAHLDFRASLLVRRNAAGQPNLTLSTVVHCHNRLGRLYLFVIAPFHRQVVQSALRRGAARGWPAAQPAQPGLAR